LDNARKEKKGRRKKMRVDMRDRLAKRGERERAQQQLIMRNLENSDLLKKTGGKGKKKKRWSAALPATSSGEDGRRGKNPIKLTKTRRLKHEEGEGGEERVRSTNLCH